MGWLFGFTSQKELREHLNRERGQHLKILGQAATNYGGHVWTVFESQKGERFIGLDLIKKSEGWWGYKDMTEDMHPFYFDCPLKLLEIAGETTNDAAVMWRKKVVQVAEAKKRKFKKGDVLEYGGEKYEVLGDANHGVQVRRQKDGNVYRLKRSQFADAKLQGEEA